MEIPYKSFMASLFAFIFIVGATNYSKMQGLPSWFQAGVTVMIILSGMMSLSYLKEFLSKP